MKDNGRVLRLGVLLSGGGRTLLNILDEISSGRLGAEVGIVIASRPCKGLERSRDAGLTGHLVDYSAYKRAGDLGGYSREIANLLDGCGVNLVLLAGFLSMWEIPDRYAGKVMNIHPALLPKFGGQGMFGHHVHDAVLAAGERETGCTVHFVTNEYDAGPIVLQKKVKVQPDDTADTLADRVFEQECIAYPQAIKIFAEGKIKLG